MKIDWFSTLKAWLQIPGFLLSLLFGRNKGNPFR